MKKKKEKIESKTQFRPKLCHSESYFCCYQEFQFIILFLHDLKLLESFSPTGEFKIQQIIVFYCLRGFLCTVYKVWNFIITFFPHCVTTLPLFYMHLKNSFILEKICFSLLHLPFLLSYYMGSDYNVIIMRYSEKKDTNTKPKFL